MSYSFFIVHRSCLEAWFNTNYQWIRSGIFNSDPKPLFNTQRNHNMSSSRAVSKADLLLPACNSQNEMCLSNDAETALAYWHRACAASETIHPRQIQFKQSTHSDTAGFCYSVNEVVAEIESGNVHSEQRFVPSIFASTNDFNDFLYEMDVLYRRSVDRWGSCFVSIQTK